MEVLPNPRHLSFRNYWSRVDFVMRTRLKTDLVNLRPNVVQYCTVIGRISILVINRIPLYEENP
jgi:hypothetical protein